MELKQPFVDEGFPVHRSERDGTVELVVDFGHGTDVSVDTVGETVIVIASGQQYEAAVSGDARAFITNGVLTIQVDK